MDLVGEWTWSGNINYHNEEKRKNYIASGGMVDRTTNFLNTVGYDWTITLHKDGSTSCYINHKFWSIPGRGKWYYSEIDPGDYGGSFFDPDNNYVVLDFKRFKMFLYHNEYGDSLILGAKSEQSLKYEPFGSAPNYEKELRAEFTRKKDIKYF